MSKNKVKNAADKSQEDYIKDCEKRYKEAFKKDSCVEIMNCYYELQNAKKKYYSSIGEDVPIDDTNEYINDTSNT